MIKNLSKMSCQNGDNMEQAVQTANTTLSVTGH